MPDSSPPEVRPHACPAFAVDAGYQIGPQRIEVHVRKDIGQTRFILNEFVRKTSSENGAIPTVKLIDLLCIPTVQKNASRQKDCRAWNVAAGGNGSASGSSREFPLHIS